MFILNRDIRFILLDSVLYDCFQASNPGFFLSLRDSFNFSVASELNEIASHFLAEAPNIDVAAAKRLGSSSGAAIASNLTQFTIPWLYLQVSSISISRYFAANTYKMNGPQYKPGGSEWRKVEAIIDACACSKLRAISVLRVCGAR